MTTFRTRRSTASLRLTFIWHLFLTKSIWYAKEEFERSMMPASNISLSYFKICASCVYGTGYCNDLIGCELSKILCGVTRSVCSRVRRYLQKACAFLHNKDNNVFFIIIEVLQCKICRMKNISSHFHDVIRWLN